MALSIKDEEAERLASEVASLTGESKTRAVRVSLQERLDRLALGGRGRPERGVRLRRFLEREAWPQIAERTGSQRVSRAEREAILGYGPEGV